MWRTLGNQVRRESISLNLGVLDASCFTNVIPDKVFRVDVVINVVDGNLRLTVGQLGNILAVQEEGECIVEC